MDLNENNRIKKLNYKQAFVCIIIGILIGVPIMFLPSIYGFNPLYKLLNENIPLLVITMALINIKPLLVIMSLWVLIHSLWRQSL